MPNYDPVMIGWTGPIVATPGLCPERRVRPPSAGTKLGTRKALAAVTIGPNTNYPYPCPASNHSQNPFIRGVRAFSDRKQLLLVSRFTSAMLPP
jgi:hypothetical protein